MVVTRQRRPVAFASVFGETTGDEMTRTPLELFALAVIEEMRSDLAGLDGYWLQDYAKKYGLLVNVEVTEPCGEACKCAEYGEFPQDCLRESDYLRPLLAAFREER